MRLRILLLNAGHFIDHLVMLVFATVAALALTREWGLGYGELVPYATPGFVAFGLFSRPRCCRRAYPRPRAPDASSPANACTASAAAARFPLRVKPDPPRGPRS